LAILTKNPKIVVATIGAIGGSGLLGLATTDFSESSSNSANVRESRLNQAFRTSIKYRTVENNLIKAKTETDKLAEKFDLERIGLTAALNAATDEETKLRIRSQLAILDNNEALAKKYNAEIEGAKALEVLKTSAFVAANALLNYQDAFSRPGVAGSFTSTAQSSGVSSFSPMPSVPITNAASIPQGFIDDIFRRDKQTGELRITVDTANTGDRFQQLIAESIQAATKNGFATTPTGAIGF